MRKNTLLALSLFFGLCLVLFACRKDIDRFVNDRDAPPSFQLEAAKIWRAQNIGNNDGRKILKPHWDDAYTLTTANRETILVVPASGVPMDNKDIQFMRFFFFTLNGNTVSGGKIVEVLAKKYDLKNNIDVVLKNYDGKVINNYNGAVLMYDINYNYTKSSNFEGGKLTAKETRILSMPVKGRAQGMLMSTPNPERLSSGSGSCPVVFPNNVGFPPSYCAGGTIHVSIVNEWDSQTHCLISVTQTFLSVTCPVASGSGSGSGSGGGGDPGPGGGGGGGGGGGVVIIDPDNDPLDYCKQRLAISRRSSDATISPIYSTVLLNTKNTGNEYGANIKISSLSNFSSYKNSPVTTNGSTNSWTPGFTWNAADGYTLGFTHGHPAGSGPSPADVWAAIIPAYNGMNSASTSDKDYYKANAFVNTETSGGNYIVTIRVWSGIDSLYQSSYSTPAQKAQFDANYIQYVQNYTAAHQNGTKGEASAYALFKLFPNMLNIYHAASNSSDYNPYLNNYGSPSTPTTNAICLP